MESQEVGQTVLVRKRVQGYKRWSVETPRHGVGLAGGVGAVFWLLRKDTVGVSWDGDSRM